MTPKRIAYLTNRYPALSHTFIRREVEGLRERGLDIQTFTIHQPVPEELLWAADITEAQRTRSLFPISPIRLVAGHAWALLRRPLRYAVALGRALFARPRGLRGLVYGLFYFAESMLLARELHRRGIQHLHNHFATGSAHVGSLAAYYLNIPWSLTLHGTCDFEYPASITLGDKVRAAVFVACASDFGRAQAMRTVASSEWTKLKTVRCGLDLPPVGTPHLRQPDAPLQLLCVARLAEEKGLPVLIDAVATLRDRGVVVRLTLVGEGPERATIEQRIAHRQLNSVCQLMGARAGDELWKLYRECDAFVLASLMEGLPVVLMEAMAVGKPVIAPSVGGIPELVTHGETGLLFNPGDATSLAAQITRLLNEPMLGRSLGEQGRRRVEQQHAIDTCLDPLADLLARTSYTHAD